MMYAVENKITEPINLGSGSGVSIREIAEIVSKHTGKEIKWDPTKPKGDHRRVLDMTRAHGYGFECEVSIEDGIYDTIEWFKDNKSALDARYDVFKS